MINYVIITPVRDEERHIEKTILSVISQTVRPIEWVIVNDGSTDNTEAIIERYLNQHNWLKALHRENRGFREAGGGVVDAFNEGYGQLQINEWDFIVKLDADLGFEPDYFKRCFQQFVVNPKLGIAGGLIANLRNGSFVIDERNPSFHVRGATKIYRRQCWTQIGGLHRGPGWDTLDEVKANMLGWETRSFPELIVRHYKATGEADGLWSSWVKNGRANYVSGYHPVFMILKCFRRFFEKPYMVMSLGLFYGFLTGYGKKVPQVPDTELIRYLRTQQIRKILGMRSIWK